jgi:hypothetical protein
MGTIERSENDSGETELQNRPSRWHKPRRVSRRDMLSRTVAAAGAVGTVQMTNGVEAKAASVDTARHGIPIDPVLLDALRFNRDNAGEPGVALSRDSGLLIGFGANLFHSDSSTASLFVNGQKWLKSMITLEVEENIPNIVVGTTGRIMQTVEDRFGNVLRQTVEVESVNDVPDNFLATSNTSSEAYNGRFYAVTTTLDTKSGSLLEGKTTCDVLTKSLPLGVNFLMGSAFRAKSPISFDHNVIPLLGIAQQITFGTFWGPISSYIPTDLQQDISFGKIFRAVVVYALTGGVAGPAPAVWAATTNDPVGDVKSAAGGLGLSLLASAIYDLLKDIFTKPAPPPPPPG